MITNSTPIADAVMEQAKKSIAENMKEFKDCVEIGADGEVKGQAQEVLLQELHSLGSNDGLHCDENAGVYVDDLTGLELDKEASKAARELEMKTFRDMEVYDYVPNDIAKAHK